MNSSQASNLLVFPGVLPKKRAFSIQEALEQTRPSHAEVGQLLRNQLQTTLDVADLLEMFFATSQRLLHYQGLSFRHAGQHLDISHGHVDGNFRIDYHLELENQFLGVLSLHNSTGLDEHALSSFESLTPALIFPLRNALKYHEVLHASLHDPLTGVRNRSGMTELLERDLQLSRRAGSSLSVLMVDIDHFKMINDRFGHAGGDAVLIAVAQLLKDQLRNMDAVFRYGGEEFLLVLPNTDMPYLQQVAERLRKSVENLAVVHDGKRIKLSVSFGAAVMRPNESQHDLLQRADDALYQAKEQGRNRIGVAG